MAGATGSSDDAFDVEVFDEGAVVVVGEPVGPKRDPPGPPMAGASVVAVTGASVAAGALATVVLGAGDGGGGVVVETAVVGEPAAFVTGWCTGVVGAET